MVSGLLSLLWRGRSVDAISDRSRDVPTALIVRFVCGQFGRWTVLLAGHPPCVGFVDIEDAVTYARRLCEAAPATLCLSVDGLVIVIPQDAGWTRLMLGERT